MSLNPFDAAVHLPFFGAGDDTLAEIDHAHPAGVVYATDDGPMVAPHVVSAARGRLWFPLNRWADERDWLRRNPEVSVLMGARDGGHVSVAGDVRVLDPLRPADGFNAIPEVVLSGMATLRYVTDHADGALSGLRGSRSIINSLPPGTLVAIRPRRMLRLNRHGDVVRRRGRWSTLMPRPEFPSIEHTVSLRGQPEAALALVAGSSPAVVGWAGDDGLVALPGEWYGQKSELHVPTSIIDLLATPSTAPIAVGLANHEGTERIVLQGTATVTEISPDHTRVAVAIDRLLPG